MSVDNEGTSEARLRRALEAASIGVWEWDSVTDQVIWSPELFVLFCMKPEEFAGTREAFFELVHPADRPMIEEMIERAYVTGRWHFEHRMSTTVPAERWFECKGRVFHDGTNQSVRMAGVVSEITDRKLMHSQLRLADRMANLGTLTASVAHEINNPLAFWLLSLQNVDRELASMERGAPAMPLSDIRKTLSEMSASAAQVREIVRDLRLFSRADEEGRRCLDVQSVLDPAVNLIAAELRPRARLVKDYAELPGVVANEARLGQVFLNLLLNATQSIAPGAHEQNEVRVRTFRSATGDAVVEISDTGTGIPAELVEHIFDPFFTTKPAGMGTGLGLSICHNIVTRLGGRITVESKLGKGSTFQVILPAALPSEATSSIAEAAPKPTGERRILIVDDAPNLASSLQLALRRHQVDAVNSGFDALEQLKTRSYDCILCDLMMPQMDGVELHAKLAELYPGLERRMIFFTGGAFTPRVREFLTRLENPLLDKPFDLERLEALIATLPPAMPSAQRRGGVPS